LKIKFHNVLFWQGPRQGQHTCQLVSLWAGPVSN
jgi:hypothetical protein